MIGRAEDVNIKIPFKLPFILNFEGKALKIKFKNVTVSVVRVRYLKEIAWKIII
jgi:hypothetical protein